MKEKTKFWKNKPLVTTFLVKIPEFLDRNIPKREGKTIWEFSNNYKLTANQSKRLFHPSSKLFMIKDRNPEDETEETYS